MQYIYIFNFWVDTLFLQTWLCLHIRLFFASSIHFYHIHLFNYFLLIQLFFCKHNDNFANSIYFMQF